MNEQVGIVGDYWPKIEALVAAAKEDPGLRDTLQFGTPDQKRVVLQDFGLSFEELLAIHHDLENVADQGVLRFWWW